MVRAGWLLVALAGSAFATHDVDGPVTDYSAYTLDQWEYRVGVGRNEVGLTDSLQLGVLELHFALGLPNVGGKWMAYETGNWAFAAVLRVFRFDASRLDEENDFRIWIVPMEAVASWRTADFTWNLGLGYTSVSTDGDVSSGDNDENLGTAFEVSVGYLHPTVEWRLGPVLALVLESRLGLYQDAAGSTVTRLNDRTTLEVHGDADASLGTALRNVSLSGFWSWPHFNVRAGLGYGNYSIPGANVFIPAVRFPYPELAVFWRF